MGIATQDPELRARLHIEDAAKRVANYFISQCSDDWMPRCDFRQPAEPVVRDNVAGNVAACGLKPDGKRWRVAIENPDIDKKIPALKNAGYIGVVEVSDKSVITSGGYERYFEEGGVRYHHIIDPKTGYPADSGLISVSIISEDGCLADGLSTAFFVMGKGRALECWSEHKEQFDCILVESNGKITVTGGLENCFSSEMSFEIYR